MTTKIEVVSSYIPPSSNKKHTTRWLKETRQELMTFALSELKVFKQNALTVTLSQKNVSVLATLSNSLNQIKRYNPTIEKIEETLNSYEVVRLELSATIDEYFSVVSLETLNEHWQRINNAIYFLDKLVNMGNTIIIENNNFNNASDTLFESYNRFHHRFKLTIQSLIRFIEIGNMIENRENRLIELVNEVEDFLL